MRSSTIQWTLAATAALIISVISAAPTHAQGAQPYIAQDQCRIMAGPDPQSLQPVSPGAPVENGNLVEVLCAYAVRHGSTDTELRVTAHMDQWEAQVAVYRNRNEMERDAQDFFLQTPNAWSVEPYRARLGYDGILKVLITGRAPSAVQLNYVEDGSDRGAAHEVQQATEFTALSVLLQDSGAQQPREEQVRLQSATGRWIDVQNRVNRSKAAAADDAAPAATNLAEDLLNQGYPNIAARVLAADSLQSDGADGRAPLRSPWLYIGGGLAGLVLVSIVALVLVPTLMQKRREQDNLTV